MFAAVSDSKKPCPACGEREGVEVVYVQPIEERVRKTDRRQRNFDCLIPESGDRRKIADRRVQNEWRQLPGTPDNPLLSCLACLHEWRSGQNSVELAEALGLHCAARLSI